MSGRDSRGHGVPRNDVNRRGADSAPSLARVSTRDVGIESMQHGPFNRIDWPGASQTLSRATGTGTLAPSAIRYDSRLEKPLSENERPGAEGGHFSHQSSGGVASIQAAAGAAGTRFGPHRKTN